MQKRFFILFLFFIPFSCKAPSRITSRADDKESQALYGEYKAILKKIHQSKVYDEFKKECEKKSKSHNSSIRH